MPYAESDLVPVLCLDSKSSFSKIACSPRCANVGLCLDSKSSFSKIETEKEIAEERLCLDSKSSFSKIASSDPA